jgi:hypothetical protein
MITCRSGYIYVKRGANLSNNLLSRTSQNPRSAEGRIDRSFLSRWPASPGHMAHGLPNQLLFFAEFYSGTIPQATFAIYDLATNRCRMRRAGIFTADDADFRRCMHGNDHPEAAGISDLTLAYALFWAHE